jgi:hypothetical protein
MLCETSRAKSIGTLFRRAIGAPNLRIEGAGARLAHRFAVGDGKQAVIWFLRRRPRNFRRGVLPPMPPLENDVLIVRGMENGSRRVTFFDSKSGEIRAQSFRRREARRARAPIPSWEHELAIAIV